MAWIGHVRQGRAIDEKGTPVSGAQVVVLDPKGRPQEHHPPTSVDGTFQIQRFTNFPPGLQVFLSHADFVRSIGPIPMDSSTVVSYEMRRKTKVWTAQFSGAPDARVAFVERDAKGLVAAFERKTDAKGAASIVTDPSCSYRNLPFAEVAGAFVRVTPQLTATAPTPLENLATELRYKEVTLLRKAALETTYRVGPETLLRFFFIPSSLNDAIALAPILDAYDHTRETAFGGIHDHLCPLVRAGVLEGIGYCAYTVPGDSVEDVVRTRGPLSDEECLRLHQEIAAVLPALEAKGLFHGNIAPRFVYRGPDGFRLAPPCPALPLGVRFQRDHHVYDGRPGDDAYGLGATLYFAAAGKPPQYDVEEVAPPPNVGGMLEQRERLKPTGRSFDPLLRSLLEG